jgi:hypothetical protein
MIEIEERTERMASKANARPAPKPATTERIARGGVSTTPHAPATRGTETILQPTGALNVAAAFPNFVYHGGPVVSCPLVSTSFWGALWLDDPAHLARAGRLSQFHQDLIRSNFMNVMSQYGAGFGAGSGAFIRASFLHNVPNTLTEAIIHSTIQACINAGAIAEPTVNSVLMIFLDENMGVNDPGAGLVLCEPANDDAFGYHSFFTTTAGHPFYYAIIPALNNACLTESCPSDAGCSLHLSETQEQRVTQVACHEFGEMITDPQLNAWYDSSSGAENGDICNGEPDSITVGPNTWNIQRFYSKYDDIHSNGATFCVSQAASPEPRLSPGPAAHPAVVARANELVGFERMLPLPPVRFDAKTNEVSVDEQAVHDYAKKVFHPLRHEHVMADFPAFLHQVADILAKK